MAIKPIPAAILESKFSLNTNHASNAVNTPSRFNSREALDAGESFSPNNNSHGPITPPKKNAPDSQGASFRCKHASLPG